MELMNYSCLYTSSSVNGTSHVLCNGEQATLANLKMTIGSVDMLLADRLSFFLVIKILECHNLDDFLVDSLVLVDRLLYLVTVVIVSMTKTSTDRQVQCIAQFKTKISYYTHTPYYHTVTTSPSNHTNIYKAYIKNVSLSTKLQTFFHIKTGRFLCLHRVKIYSRPYPGRK